MRMSGRTIAGYIAIGGVAAALAGCGSIGGSNFFGLFGGGNNNGGNGGGGNPTPSTTFAAIDDRSHLITFTAATPQTIASDVAIQGINTPNEAFVGADFNPVDGSLYGLTSFGRLLRINTVTGAITQTGSLNINGLVTGFNFIPGTSFMRVVTNNNDNLQINLDGAVVSTDTSLAYSSSDANSQSSPSVSGLAYTPGSPSDVYTIDSSLHVLARIGGSGGNPSANGGVLTTIGSIGVTPVSRIGMDVSPTTGLTYVCFTPQTSQSPLLYGVDLTNGRLSPVGSIGTQSTIEAMAVEP